MTHRRKKAERRPPVDLSPEAIDRRLRDLGQLYRLGKAITGARWLGTVRELGLEES
jgi:hypothetical protein